MKVDLRADEELLGAALDYARRGWKVLACEPRGKRPLLAHGLNDATTDPEVIRGWWLRWPTANVGIATGMASGFWVLDCDGEEGDASMREIERGNGPVPHTVLSLTGGGGLHFLFRMPGDGDIRNSASKIMPGVDVRGSGGYIVAPPSWHANGRRYMWEAECHPDDLKFVDAPDWLVALVRKNSTPTEGFAPRVDGPIRSGSRNETLASMAGSMRRRGMSEAGILAALLEENKRCTPPLPEQEVRGIAKSMARYAPAQGSAPRPEGNGSAAPSGDPDATADKKSSNVYELLRVSDILSAPRQEWIVDDWIPKGALVVLFGAPESAKSFVAISLMLAVATGRKWVNRFDSVKTGVLYCAGEGIGGMRLRLLAAAHDAGADLLGESEPTVRFLPTVPRLMDSGDQIKYYQTVDSLDPRPGLVVVDTLSRGLLGAEENSARDVGLAVDVLDTVRRRSGGTVLVVHHSGKDSDRGMRGSSALLGAADVVISAKREESAGGMSVTLRAEKVKDGRKPAALALSLDEVHLGVDEKQRAVTSLRVREESQSDRTHTATETERKVLGVLEAAEFVGVGVRIGELMELSQVGRTQCWRVLQGLISTSRVRKVGQKYVAVCGGEN